MGPHYESPIRQKPGRGMSMRPVRVRLGSACAVLLAFIGPGCVGFHRETPVAVLVRDAETKAPVPGAQVRLSCLHLAGKGGTPSVAGTAERDGVVQLRAVVEDDADYLVDATAPGYLFVDRNVTPAAMR